MSTAGNGHPLYNLARFLACTSIGKTNVLDPEELQSILFHRVDASGSLWGERPSRSVKDQASNRTLLRVNSLLEKLKVPGETWRCPNWVFALQPYCTMVPTPPPSVPEVSTIPLPQTDSIAPGLSLSSQDLLSIKATCRDYVARDGSMLPLLQHAQSLQQEKRVRALLCLFSLFSLFNDASFDNCGGIPWAPVAISFSRTTGTLPH